MRRLLSLAFSVAFLLVFLTNCDSGHNLPDFSMVISSPASETVLQRTGPFDVKVEITSEIDILDMDIALAPRGQGEAGLYVGEGVRVHRLDAYRQYAVDTTLVVPNFDPTFGNDFVLIFMSPARSTNVVRAMDVRVE